MFPPPCRQDQQRRANLGVLRCGGRISHQCFHRQIRAGGGDILRRDINAWRGIILQINVQRVGGNQPDLPVKSAPDRVKPIMAGQTISVIPGIIIHSDGQRVAAGMQSLRCIKNKPRVGAAMLSESLAVHINVRNCRSAFKNQIKTFAGKFRRDGEIPAIPPWVISSKCARVWKT